MKLETLESAYRRLVKKKYTTRADLARNCDFSLMTATNVARELIDLGLVFERKLTGGTKKLSAYDMEYTFVKADLNEITMTVFDKSMKTVHTDFARRNFSFPLVEDISIFLQGRYEQSDIFPCLFVGGVPEVELEIFSDLLPVFAPIPDGEKDIKRFMREYMLKSKTEQKALANITEM
ncbi:MAG: hypothetical protein E7640_06595 [Ruminococcaceae bacterium]|nr:hypothetical protein [Oscillospiraceae bacterium]